jgi:hypothetical protein
MEKAVPREQPSPFMENQAFLEMRIRLDTGIIGYKMEFNSF